MPLTAKAKFWCGAIAALALVALFITYGEWRVTVEVGRANDRHAAAIEKLKGEAAKELAAQVTYTMGVERDLREAHDRNRKESEEHDRTVDALEKRLITVAARSGGRLRDPNAEGCGRSGGGAAAPAAAAAADRGEGAAQAGGLLSLQLSDLLRARLREADDVNNAYAACRVEVVNLRSKLSPP